ncbi:MAG: dihydropteroate synthase [Treponema sp.]|nr:dihydropteroate synthase [Treponema sp.]
MLELTFGNKKITTELPAFVMGIVNATPDSFYDGSRGGLERALELVEQGAQIIDIGGESTRPGFTPVSDEEEIERVIPLLCGLRKKSDVIVSIDTTKTKVMKAAIENGADIINNVGEFTDEELELCKNAGVSVIVMHHTSGGSKEIVEYLTAQANRCLKTGIPQEKIIIDPGIGFGKTFEQNVDAIKNTEKLAATGFTTLMALSRKSSIGQITGREVHQRLAGTLAADIISVQKGAKIIRVHDVSEAIDTLKVMKFL